VGAKGPCHAGPPRSGETGRPDSREGSSAGRMVARKGSGSRPESARGVGGGSPENRWVTWLSHKTKTGGSAGRDRIRARREASMPTDAWRDRRAPSGGRGLRQRRDRAMKRSAT
jgi:hypothetical protein